MFIISSNFFIRFCLNIADFVTLEIVALILIPDINRQLLAILTFVCRLVKTRRHTHSIKQ